MATSMIPFTKPAIGPQEVEAVRGVLESGWLTHGPMSQNFELQFASFVNVRRALAVSSCTDGLRIALAAHGIGNGDIVILPTMTFAATANIVVQAGATPVFVDSEEPTLAMSRDAVERVLKAFSSKRKQKQLVTILPVHLYGLPYDVSVLRKIADEWDVVIIEDAAHAAGARYANGWHVGTQGNTAVFSFYATKNMTTGEGGMITTDDDGLADQFRLWRSQGIDRDVYQRKQAPDQHCYDVVVPGFKANMTDIQAAIGVQQLARLPKAIEERRQQAALYKRLLSDEPSISLPPDGEDGVQHAWHIFAVRLRDVDRGEVSSALRRDGIETSVHFVPLHRMSYYQERYSLSPADFPVADRAGGELLSLPMYPGLSGPQQCQVVERLKYHVWRCREADRNL